MPSFNLTASYIHETIVRKFGIFFITYLLTLDFIIIIILLSFGY